MLTINVLWSNLLFKQGSITDQTFLENELMPFVVCLYGAWWPHLLVAGGSAQPGEAWYQWWGRFRADVALEK